MVSVVSMRNIPSSALLVLVLSVAQSAWAQARTSSVDASSAVTGPAACEEGKVLAEQARNARALLMLERCHRAKPDADVRTRMAGLRKLLEPRRQSSTNALAPVSFALTPEHATARLSGNDLPEAYRDIVLLGDDELWLPQGHYEIEVVATGYEGGRFAIDVESSGRMLVPISLKQETAPSVTEIDMGEDAGPGLGQVASTPDPRPKKFKTLLAKRYAQAPRPEPLPAQPRRSTRGPWPYVAAATSAAAIATGLVLQTQEHRRPALAGYGAGLLAGGLATYLFLRTPGPGPQRLALDLGGRHALLVWQGEL